MEDKDKLKEYFNSHRHEFDDLEPSEKMWANIESEIQNNQTDRSSFNWWKAAAVLFMVCTVGLVTFMFLRDNQAKPQITVSTYDIPEQMNGVSFDQVSTETYYFQLISERQKEIEQMDVPESISKAYDNELESLLNDYAKLKKDLEANPGNEMLIQALVNNLKLQIDLLNEQLLILENYKNYENENNENHKSS
ncbi:hypothetical protein OO013_17795 [Mangrovivirga sp. M17]|uniref:Anti-sigma factor n=1 Tax=Mangrovivirga halotolerans TaxID=2993936 RepID=A0ABT3RVU1_9BACT|nr:hypothetical protein [Mangrovivirga halotolerans]MCX2745740.1 hypothetical protein [Mangrovivirga halotolerans]